MYLCRCRLSLSKLGFHSSSDHLTRTETLTSFSDGALGLIFLLKGSKSITRDGGWCCAFGSKGWGAIRSPTTEHQTENRGEVWVCGGAERPLQVLLLQPWFNTWDSWLWCPYWPPLQSRTLEGWYVVFFPMSGLHWLVYSCYLISFNCCSGCFRCVFCCS